MRVLAAEDNRTNQLVFHKMVRDLEIDLVFANNGREAVELFRTFRPDLIFMDISMPEMDGREAARAIRALEADLGGHVPIVALTAHAMDGDDAGHPRRRDRPLPDETAAQDRRSPRRSRPIARPMRGRWGPSRSWKTGKVADT